ncbi:28S ribosomal protein S5, mitochondrial [Arachnomyces sp. PD_36]|nr:28S ribosomal protein S5, mitochondrial [Arachnomyces sp. PD_36]
MSLARPSRCLFCTFSRATAIARVPRRQFHLSPASLSDRKPKHPSIKAADMGKFAPGADPSNFKAYTEEEKARFKEEYSKAQIEAIEAGEKAVNPEDMSEQFNVRSDPWALQYLDDFSTIEPVVDKHVRAPESNTDPNARLKDEDELLDDMAQYLMKMPEDPSAVDWLKFTDNLRLTVGKEENELNPSSSLVPDLVQEGETLEKKRVKKQAGPDEEVTPALQRLMQSTGFSLRQIRTLKVKSIVSHSVVNQTRLGKIQKSYVLSIAGNGNGLIGIGEGKSMEFTEARVQSQYRAIRNMQPIPRYEQRTIFGDVTGKVGAVELKLMTRPPGKHAPSRAPDSITNIYLLIPGFGLRCQKNIFEMCRVAGIQDLAARVSRSRNPMNTVKAAYQALMSQKDPEEVARARGKKLVDVRKVYYAGNI